jgi:hypothetical protein
VNRNRIGRSRLAGIIAGLALATTVVVVPVLATTAPSAAQSPSGLSTPSLACALQRLAAKASPSIQTLRAVGDCQIERRLDTITRLRTEVSGAPALTGEHKSALEAILDASKTGLLALRTKINADPDIATLRADNHAIFADYRIYALVSRQVRLVRGDDHVVAAAGRLTKGASTVQAAIAAAQSHGKDVTAATAKLTAMNGAISAALAEANGDAATVLSLTPAGWNAGTAKPVLDAARASIVAARGDLRTALADGLAAIAALK